MYRNLSIKVSSYATYKIIEIATNGYTNQTKRSNIVKNGSTDKVNKQMYKTKDKKSFILRFFWKRNVVWYKKIYNKEIRTPKYTFIKSDVLYNFINISVFW